MRASEWITKLEAIRDQHHDPEICLTLYPRPEGPFETMIGRNAETIRGNYYRIPLGGS